MSHLSKVVVIEVEKNEHLGMFGATVAYRNPGTETAHSKGGMTVVELEEWLVDRVRELHLHLPKSVRHAKKKRR